MLFHLTMLVLWLGGAALILIAGIRISHKDGAMALICEAWEKT